MSKKVFSVVDDLRSEIRLYANQLKGCIDRSGMVRAYQTRRRSERLYAYHSLLRDACCICFRGSSVSYDGKKCIVWGFNGELWRIIPAGVFRDVVGEALIGASGSGDFVVKGDWMDKQSVILQSAYSGVCSSPLGDNPSVVGFENGVWDFGDIHNPVYHPFDDKLPIIDKLPYSYDVKAGCRLWLSFLKMMLKPNDILRLQKYMGLGVMNRRLLGRSVEDTLWLVGSGANGKSTILNVIRAVFGYDKISEASLGELLDRNQDARMRAIDRIEGKIFNLCGEVDVADITRGADAFKKLCSGEPHNARGIGKDIHTAYDIPFMIFSMNQRPSNRRMDAAFRRRIVEIDFERTIHPKDMDPALGTKLMGELSGIRNWCIEGYKKLEKDRFKFGKTNDESYMESNGQYFDIFAGQEGLRPAGWAGHDERAQLVNGEVLYEMYASFCEKNLFGAEPPSRKSMASDMKRLGYNKVRKASGVYYEIYSDNKLKYSDN